MAARRWKRSLALTAAVASTVLSAQRVLAALQWDPAHTPGQPSGGAGFWDYASTSWSNGNVDAPWNSTDAIFGGAAGTVTIDSGGTGVVATGLTFNTAG